MKNRGIITLLISLAILIAIVVTWDFISKRPDVIGGNPYELDVSEYTRTSDTSLIVYKEIRNIKLDSVPLRAVAFKNDKIYVLGSDFLQSLDQQGRELMRISVPEMARCMTIGNQIFIGYNDHIVVYDINGNYLTRWDTIGSRSVLTSLSVKDYDLFAADAGNRRVLHFNTSGKIIGQFEGKSDSGQVHGFIIPSPYFDLAVNEFGELWVVNPGKHALEQYTYDGRMMGFWEKASFNIDGFSGCCNPAQIAVLPDGNFVTSEKGLVRIKVHKPSGELLGIVGPTESLGRAFLAPDIAVTPEGNIIALDFDNQLIRIYRHK